MTSLNLSSQRLTTLPANVEGKVRLLSVSDNRLTTLPPLPPLEWLEGKWNQFREMPHEICRVQTLTFLDLSDNFMHALPVAIVALERLRTLRLGQNCLKELPQELGRLPSLEELVLFENQLTVLPDSIEHLSSLRILDVRFNCLRSLPVRLGRCQKLTDLYLWDNPDLGVLPPSLGEVRWLTRIENMGTMVPDEVIEAIWQRCHALR